MLQKILFALILFTQIGCTQNKGEPTMQSILTHKPYFTVNINVVNTKIVINLNGESIYTSFNKRPKHLVVPVNHLMISGENVLEVKLLAFKRDNLTLSPKAEVTVTLQVADVEKLNTPPVAISQIVYAKASTIDSSIEGTYNSLYNFKADKNGDVKISRLLTEKLSKPRITEEVRGISLTQNVTLQTPFPRWSFLDSDNIVEGNFYDMNRKAYDTLRKRKDIEVVYQIHQRIYDALQRKDVDSIIDLFDERNQEMDIAMYEPKGYYKNLLYKRLKEDVNNNTRNMLKFIPNKRFFYISEGGKTLYIRSAIVFNNNAKDGSTNYPVLFRKEKGKWIITR